VDRVAGKIAFITGAARGQGRMHAVRLAQEGADVVVVDALQSYSTIAYPMATEADLDETVALVEATGRKALARQADVRNVGQLQAVVDEAIESFGRIDIVSANAGIMPPGAPFWELTPQEWADVIGVNLVGVANTVSAAVPSMIAAGQGGSIVITSSAAGLRATNNLATYNSSKFGVIGLGKTMANELAAHRIRVNVICPISVDTTMIHNDGLYHLLRPDLEAPTRADVAEVMSTLSPIPEPWIEPIDVSNALVYLASDEARYVTGVVLPVDLGFTNKAM
jgi:(+)-trans-carveol dehydrogenase